MTAWHLLAVGFGMTALVVGAWVFQRYLRDLRAAHGRLAQQSRMIQTDRGWVEHGTAGNGDPVLVIHGAGGGFDQGLHLGALFVGEGFRLIAPSRFGYLESPVPADHSLQAQADVFASLLDALGIDRVAVIAISSGGLSALQFAQCYPERTRSVVLVAAVTHTAPPTTGERMREARINRVVGSNLSYWLVTHAARPPLLRLLGVAREVQANLTPEESAQVDRFLESMLPMSRRVEGIALDQSRSPGPNLPVDRIRVPTLVIHAQDDSLVDIAHADYAATRIQGAERMTFESGGHLLLGHHDTIRKRIAAFLRNSAGRGS